MTADRTTLLRGGHVYGAVPGATAMLVVGSVIAWMGADEDVPAVISDEVIDLGGDLVLPAFVDAHVHATHTGLALEGLDLTAATSLADALDRIAAHARLRPGSAVLGSGWDETRWPEGRPPTATELDNASGNAVVYLARVDVHSAVASSALLALVDDIAPVRGFSVNGQVRLDAHHAVRHAAYATVDATTRANAQRASRRRAAEMGIGAVHEMGGPDIAGEADFTQLLELAATELGPAVIPYWGEMHAVDRARDLGAVGVGGDLFVDGSVGSHTAWLSSPYDDAHTCGHGWLTADEISEHVIACAEARMQTGFHAIGDLALRTVVDGFAAAAAVVGNYALGKGRHRVEHAELAPDPAAFARLGLVASVQPAFDAAWGGSDGMYVQRLGTERAAAMNPLRSLATAGVALAFGSDAPVTALDPWGTIRAAVYHQTPGYGVDIATGINAHTIGGWRAAHVDDAGVLAPGARATYAVWDVPAMDPATALPDLDGGLPTCRRTVIGGETAFDREGALA